MVLVGKLGNKRKQKKKTVQLENTILGANLKYRSNIPKKSSDLIHLLRAQGWMGQQGTTWGDQRAMKLVDTTIDSMSPQQEVFLPVEPRFKTLNQGR